MYGYGWVANSRRCIERRLKHIPYKHVAIRRKVVIKQVLHIFSHKPVVGVCKDKPFTLSVVHAHVAGIACSTAFLCENQTGAGPVMPRVLAEVHDAGVAVVVNHNHLQVVALWNAVKHTL